MISLLVASAFLVVYSYILYPILLWSLARFARRQESPARPSRFPLVSVVVAAHNEESVIEKKIDNTQALEYPEGCLELLIGSDGSTDRTDEICRQYSWVRFFRIEPRGGKANVLNTLIPHAQGEIIVLSDANTLIEPEALIAMVKHFNDPTVGGVCGQMVLTSSQQQQLEAVESTYVSHEVQLKKLESRCFSTIGAHGGIYAIRKDLFASIPTDTIIDDFLISMKVLEQDKRLVFEHEAIAYEEVSKSFRDEFLRKVRIGAGNLQFFLRKRDLFLKVPIFVTFAYLSHKVIRWFVPFLLVNIWVCSLFMSDRQPFSTLFWVYNFTLLLPIVGVMRVSRNRLVKAFTYLYSFNLALLIGYGRYLLGIQRVTWQRAQR